MPLQEARLEALGPLFHHQMHRTQAYQLALPSSMHIHNVFHVSLLEPYYASTIPGHMKPPLPPVVMDSEQEFEID